MFTHFLVDPFFLGIVEDNGSPISYSDKSALEKTQKVGEKFPPILPQQGQDF